MKALVVYESIFGNTRHVAEAIAGGPTHVFGMSRRSTRQAALMPKDGKPATEPELVSPLAA